MIAGSWFQRPDFHHWTWYTNSGGARKDRSCTRRRSLENCRVFRSAEFTGIDHKLLVATLKIRLKYRKIQPSSARCPPSPGRERCPSFRKFPYKRETDVSDDREILEIDFKTEVLKVWEGCPRDTPGTFKS